MNIKNFRSVYFLGIGGIGMSSLARYFARMGSQVSGYDKTPTPLTSELIREGMDIHFDEDPARIPKDTQLVIFTPAIPEENKELIQIRHSGLPLMKRAEILGAITLGTKTIAVAGTHGKTTTSTLIAHILHQAGLQFTAFLGGISKNYDSNYIEYPGIIKGEATVPGTPDYFVVEADEFDKSFLQLFPHIAVITSTDADHLDIYGNVNKMLESFGSFARNVEEDGFLIVRSGLKIAGAQPMLVSEYTYHHRPEADFYPEQIRVKHGLYHFDLVTPSGKEEQLVLGLPGLFNLENSIAASAVAWILGIPGTVIKSALSTYRGVKRRFDFRVMKDNFIYIDDYAHHPEELRACIQAVKDLYPGRKITGVFQPHLYTRTRDLADDFARSLALLDVLYLLEIYPAREKEITGINSKFLLDRINLPVKQLVEKKDLVNLLRKNRPEVLLTLGAGDIDQMVTPITEAFGGE